VRLYYQSLGVMPLRATSRTQYSGRLSSLSFEPDSQSPGGAGVGQVHAAVSS